MIVLNTTPINNAITDFFENNRSNGALYKLDFDEVVQRVPEFSQDNNPTNTIKVEALQSNDNTRGGFALLNMNLPPLSSNLLNFLTFVKIQKIGSPINMQIPIINESSQLLVVPSSFLGDYSTQTLLKPILGNNAVNVNFAFRNIFYIEYFSEEALRSYTEFVAYYLLRHLLAAMHHNILLSVPPVIVAAPIYTQPNLGATNIKDVTHYFESYLYNGLEGEDDRVVFMLHPVDYQRLLRLKDSAGNYVFCSNCVWNNVIELGKSVIVNAGWNTNPFVGSGLFTEGNFIVFPMSKFRFIYDGDLWVRIVRDSAINRYSLELYVACKGESGFYSVSPFAPFTLASWVLRVNYQSLFGAV